MQTLQDYLSAKNIDAALVSIFVSLAGLIKKIAHSVRTSDNSGKAGTKNIYGEEQIKLDVLANKILTEGLKKNERVGLVASEEMDGELKLSEGQYAVCYDPLDGSSLVDVNLSVGTIIGIYKAKSFSGLKGDDQVASVISVYGPKTLLLLTFRQGVAEFVLNEKEEFIFVKDNFKIADEGKMFAPGNLRACKFRQEYQDLLNYWCKNQYTLRYSGGMVPDIYQILNKGGGVFTYPGYREAPDGKLRLLFECAPMALLVEQAGGMATDGKMRILDKVVDDLGKRTPIYIGSGNEVRKVEEFLNI